MQKLINHSQPRVVPPKPSVSRRINEARKSKGVKKTSTGLTQPFSDLGFSSGQQEPALQPPRQEQLHVEDGQKHFPVVSHHGVSEFLIDSIHRLTHFQEVLGRQEDLNRIIKGNDTVVPASSPISDAVTALTIGKSFQETDCFNFCGLPLHVRNKVYAYSFGSHQCQIQDVPKIKAHPLLKSRLAILHEVAPEFWKSNRIVLEIQLSSGSRSAGLWKANNILELNAFCALQRSTLFQHIKSIDVCVTEFNWTLTRVHNAFLPFLHALCHPPSNTAGDTTQHLEELKLLWFTTANWSKPVDKVQDMSMVRRRSLAHSIVALFTLAGVARKEQWTKPKFERAWKSLLSQRGGFSLLE